MPINRRTLILALGVVVAGAIGPALADRGRERENNDDDDDDHDRRRDHDDVYDARRSGAILPLRDILPIVEKAYPGEIVEIEFEREDGIPVYEFKVVQRRGRYLEIYVDARTGEIIEVDGD